MSLSQGPPGTAAAAGGVDVMASMDFGSSLVIDFDNQADPDATVRGSACPTSCTMSHPGRPAQQQSCAAGCDKAQMQRESLMRRWCLQLHNDLGAAQAAWQPHHEQE